MLPFTDPLVAPWKFAIDDRGDVVQVRNLRHNPLTPDPADVPAVGQAGRCEIMFTCGPEFRRALDEAVERMNRLASLPSFKITY